MFQNELIGVKFISGPESFITHIEIKLEPHVTPDYVARFYNVLKTYVNELKPECTGIRELCIEEGRYPTTV